MSVLIGSYIEDSDENEDGDFFIETEESEDSSRDSDSDLGDRPTLTVTFINFLTYSPRAMRWCVCHPWLPVQDCACRSSHVNPIANKNCQIPIIIEIHNKCNMWFLFLFVLCTSFLISEFAFS
ncbi:hypothetical protein E2C01_095697 [Portunus trituberculatus]|uniref:Uncharacterized protein n=1 Tax=Portunus trituberculatus TaxID=210409 RepID=A0A5B7K023_PORTR|nr:hypothetical protein [Portunus trituberculatus]